MRRVRYALAALAFALVVGIILPSKALACSPLCPLYDVWHPLYYFHTCWDCPPPPPEG
jgi:hypothetical protein